MAEEWPRKLLVEEEQRVFSCKDVWPNLSALAHRSKLTSASTSQGGAHRLRRRSNVAAVY